MVDKLQNIQFFVIKNRITMEARMSNKAPLGLYNVSFLLQSGDYKIYPTIYNDALFQVRIILFLLINSNKNEYSFSIKFFIIPYLSNINSKFTNIYLFFNIKFIIFEIIASIL